LKEPLDCFPHIKEYKTNYVKLNNKIKNNNTRDITEYKAVAQFNSKLKEKMFGIQKK